MIPINPTVKFWILVVLTGLIAALQALIKLQPAWAWAGAIVQILSAVELYLTVPSGPSDPIKRAAKGLAPLVVLCLCLTGCPQAVAVVPPSVQTLTCIATDVVAAKTLAQIISDCGGDAVAIITAILTSTDPAVTSSSAYAEAKSLKARLGALP